MNIYLIGYRCTGKTAVAENLGKQLDWPVIDADEELVKEYEQTISQIVEEEGWDSFRKKEKAVTRKLSFLDKYVIATGGGVILNKDNIHNLRRSGIVVWLRAEEKTILNRLLNDEKTEEQRPDLTDQSLEAEINETLTKRIPLYEKTMDFLIDTDESSISEISQEIISTLNKRGLKI